MGGLPSENCTTGLKAGSFRRIKNKEQGSHCRAQSRLGSWGLAKWIYCVSSQVGCLGGHESYLHIGLLIWHSGQEWVHLRSGIIFQPCSSRQPLSRLSVMSSPPWLWCERPFHSHSLRSTVRIWSQACEWRWIWDLSRGLALSSVLNPLPCAALGKTHEYVPEPRNKWSTPGAAFLMSPPCTIFSVLSRSLKFSFGILLWIELIYPTVLCSSQMVPTMKAMWHEGTKKETKIFMHFPRSKLLCSVGRWSPFYNRSLWTHCCCASGRHLCCSLNLNWRVSPGGLCLLWYLCWVSGYKK